MIEKPSYCFLINNASNASKAGDYFHSHEKQIKGIFQDIELVYINQEDSISEIARAKAIEFTHIIACGGDGTVNRVVNGIVERDVILGVIPLGSGNDFARSIGLTKNFNENLSVLKAEQITEVDVINSDWGYFINTFGIGLDGLTNYYAGLSSFTRGMLRYFWGGLKALFQTNPFDVTVSMNESEATLQYRCWMVAVANGKNEGGRYTISPNSCNYDGKIEVVIVTDISRLRLVYEFLKLSIGISFNKNIVDVFVTEKGCKIETDIKVKTHADGEQINMGKVNKFSLVKGGIKVISNFPEKS